jgi:hypothetical protein
MFLKHAGEHIVWGLHISLQRLQCQGTGREQYFKARTLQCGTCLRALSFWQAMATTAAEVGKIQTRLREGYDTSVDLKGCPMAKKRKRKYSKSSGSDVKNEMHRYKRGKAKSGPGGKGGKVKSRKQAIAIGLSKARKKGKKVPRKKS